MNEEFAHAAIPIFDQAVIDGEVPKSWSMTTALYRNLYRTEGWFTEARKVYSGSRAPHMLAGLPIDVTAGAHHKWSLYCESGAIYDERGRSKWSNSRAASSTP